MDYWEQQEEVSQLNNLPLPEWSNPTKEQIADLEELGHAAYIVLWERIYSSKSNGLNIYAFANNFGFPNEGHIMHNPESKSLTAFYVLLTWFVIMITTMPAQVC